MSSEAQGVAASEPRPAREPESPGGAGPDLRARRALLRGAVALGRARLRGTRGFRLGLAAAVLIGVVDAFTLLLLSMDDPSVTLDGTLVGAAGWLAWTAAGPIALAAAHDRAAADRGEGIEALAAARGVPPGGLEAARALAAMQMIALVIGAPALVLAGIGALLAGGAGAALRFASLGAALVLFAAVAGVTLGGLAAMSGRVAGPRGRGLFAAIVLVPWALADLAGSARWSIPGALDAFLSMTARAAGGFL